MLTKDKSGFQQPMQDCLIAWPASPWSFWPGLIIKCVHTIKPFQVSVWVFPEWGEVLHCSLVAECGPLAAALLYIHKSALHTLAVLVSRAGTNTRRFVLLDRNRVKNDPDPWVSRKHQILPGTGGHLTNNEQVWVSTLSERADTDGLECSAWYSPTAAYILHPTPWQATVANRSSGTSDGPLLSRRSSFFPEKIWLNWFREKQ